MVWRFWMAGVRGDTADRQWALRQAAEAQNHIFDRYGFLLRSPLYRCLFFHLCVCVVLANVMDYALFRERTVS